jgi:hypothetical protein
MSLTNFGSLSETIAVGSLQSWAHDAVDQLLPLFHCASGIALQSATDHSTRHQSSLITMQSWVISMDTCTLHLGSLWVWAGQCIQLRIQCLQPSRCMSLLVGLTIELGRLDDQTRRQAIHNDACAQTAVLTLRRRDSAWYWRSIPKSLVIKLVMAWDN